MATTGTALLDFGAFPGKSDASIAVMGQGAIVAGSLVDAWVRPVASAEHTADEHLIENITIMAGNIVAGTGFTIYGFCTSPSYRPAPTTDSTTAHLLYGRFTVAWVWN